MTIDSNPEAVNTVGMSEALRAAFHPQAVGKLPRIICKDCSKAPTRNCKEHSKRQCDICGNYITTRHIHLDYVGHAEVTDRLLSVDPTWNWEPLEREVDPGMMAVVASMAPESILEGLAAVLAVSPPRVTRTSQGDPCGMWIKLTVGGVTRLGYGTVEPGKTDPEKQLIGDAIRNAAMRFGVALTLWSKGLLDSEATPGEGPDAVPVFPEWELLGYESQKQMDHHNGGLKALLDSIPRDQRDPVRQWCIFNEYYTADEATGELVAVPLPVKREHVDDYRKLLQGVVDGLPAPPTGTTESEAPADTQPVLAVDPEMEAKVVALVAGWKADHVRSTYAGIKPSDEVDPEGGLGAFRLRLIELLIAGATAGTVDLDAIF